MSIALIDLTCNKISAALTIFQLLVAAAGAILGSLRNMTIKCEIQLRLEINAVVDVGDGDGGSDEEQ